MLAEEQLPYEATAAARARKGEIMLIDPEELQVQRVLVTGGNQGIGQAIVDRFGGGGRGWP